MFQSPIQWVVGMTPTLLFNTCKLFTQSLKKESETETSFADDAGRNVPLGASRLVLSDPYSHP